MPKQAKRKFLALDVGEVSLVDEPANESPIAVMKRKEQEDMSTPAKATNKNAPAAESGAPQNPAPVQKSADDEGTERVPVEVDSDNSDVLKRLEAAVNTLVEKSIDDDDEDVEKAGKKKPGFMEKQEEEKQKKMDALRKQLESAGLSKKEVDKAVATAFGTSTKKSDEGEGDEDQSAAEDKQVQKTEAAMDALDALDDAIKKAKKFTPKRMAELEAITTKLQGLLNDLQPSEPGAGAGGLEAEGASTPEVPTTKAKGDQSEALTDERIAAAVQKALAPLAEELASIKKTRLPSTANRKSVV